MCALGFVIACISTWQEVKAHVAISRSIRELHNVEVLAQDGPRLFTVMVPGKDNWPLHDDWQTIKLCSVGDNLPLVPGMVMTKFQYKQRDGCQLIDAQTEVDYLRNDSKDVIDRSGNLLFAKEN